MNIGMRICNVYFIGMCILALARWSTCICCTCNHLHMLRLKSVAYVALVIRFITCCISCSQLCGELARPLPTCNSKLRVLCVTPSHFCTTSTAFAPSWTSSDSSRMASAAPAATPEQLQQTPGPGQALAPEQPEQTQGTGDKTAEEELHFACLLYTSPSPRDGLLSRMPSSA